MMKKIFIPQPAAEEAEDWLREKGYLIIRGSGKSDRESVKKDIADCDAMLLRTWKIDREILESGRKLKVVARHGAGYDNIDRTAAEELGIRVTYSPDTTAASVSEFAVLSILSLAKKHFDFSKELRNENFGYKFRNQGMDVAGKTLGIIGFGRIGSLTARKAFYGLDMKILAYIPRTEGKNIPGYVEVVPREELFRRSDFISLHVPGGEKTRGMIGKKEFAQMKKSAYIIQLSRGGVMDEQAFCEAVKNHTIAGGAVDVFETEPPADDHPLFQLPNVILTPHIGSNTEECMRRIAMDNAMDIDRVLSGQEPLHPVGNPGER